MQRVRVSLPGFLSGGWEVTVLTVDDPTPTAPTDPALNATVPPGVRVERVFCLSRRWTAWLGVGNVALRSLPFLFFRGCRLLRQNRYDVVYFSTTMFVVLPFGRLWKTLFGVPYVVDLQDPWVSDFYERPGAPRPPGGWKYQVAHGLGRGLEGWTMRGAAHIIAVSADYLDTLRRRYPGLRHRPMTELPFGSPDPDLRQVAEIMKDRAPILPPGGLRLAFAGALGPGMLAAVEVLFAAMAEVRRAGIAVSAHFYGTSYSPQARSQAVTLALAARHGLSDCVHEQPERLRYFDALQVTMEAEVNLLFGSTDLAFVPSKILTVLAAGRPVLALAPAGSALLRRLALLGQSGVSFPLTGGDAASIGTAVAELQILASPRRTAPDLSALLPFRADALAASQLGIFASVCEPARPELISAV
jgi:hypothetical protein